MDGEGAKIKTSLSTPKNDKKIRTIGVWEKTAMGPRRIHRRGRPAHRT